ncbi:Class I peptide chain release factor [hydrothermal vent metagenome]|uniref:Class I peptide chain release factor n=1 Tax=hydrothermal vent metagenome TaxID=652676 RepID=A0A3B1DF17_9ZZZZ
MKKHPATLPIDELLKGCQLQRMRRSGPGGQHRNKVETAVIATHLSSGVQAEANERRSPEQNRQVALFRLRLNLALQIRTQPILKNSPSLLWQERCNNRRVKVNSHHDDFPTLLAEILDLLSLFDWSANKTAEHLQCSMSQLIKFLKQESRAFAMLNTHRKEQGLSLLK